MADLLSCPFCGKDAQIAPDEIGSGGQHVPPYHAGCLRGAGCGIAFTADDPDEAIAEWNRRALAERAGGVKVKPRLTDAMIRAACMAHFGSDNIEGIDVTAHDHNWSFRDAFRRMWHGAFSALTTEPAAPEGRQEDERIRREMDEILRKQSERDIPFVPTTRSSEQAVTEATGEWREVETNFQLKGRRRSPAYFPATGEICEVSGPNCDDANGFTWGGTTVLWQNEIFVLYGSKGYWPVLHKHEHVLFRPAAIKAAMEAGRHD